VRRTTLTALLMAGALALTACASDSAASEGAGDAGGNGGEEESQNDHDHGDPVTAEPLTQRHEFTALAAAATTEGAFFARAADANRLLRRGHVARGADQAAAACAILRAQYDRGERVRLLPPVQHLYHADRFDEVTELLNHPIWADRARHQPLRHYTLANMHYLRGEWDDALAAAATSATLARELDSPVDAGAARMLCLIELARGRLDEATAAAGNTPPPMIAALLAHAQGQPDQVRAALPAVWESLRASLLGPDVVLHALWPVLLPLCLAVRDRDTAEEIGAVVANVADRAEVRSATAAGLHARGLLDDDPEPLLAAVEAYRDTPRLVDRTACHEAAGLALARRGQPDDAATHLQAAAESYEAMRAVRHLARVEAGLRQIGVSRGRRRSRTQPTTGWGSLTPTERSVAALVADGLVYREVGERLFISRRTVETHVANMFTKLDIASRAELAALVRRHAADLTTQ
jgi:DNA-binding NarL/FixJ family response regulator